MELDEWLDEVSYAELNSTSYVPSEFALNFMNFIKLVNGVEGESHKTPPVHLAMLDKIANTNSQYIANLCFRGAAKTTLFMEYFLLYVAVFGGIPGLPNISGMIYVSDSMDNGVKSARNNIEFRYNNSPFLQRWLPKAKFTEAYIEFENAQGHRLGCKMFGAKTGLRGTKIFGKRPVLAILDDLISDDDAHSKANMDKIKDTVYKGVNHAMDPTKRRVIFNGTPFNKDDILIEAVESGEWDVNVWPVCERFPCTQEEFVGAWEDRFTYEFVLDQYNLAKGTGKLASFYQELMLRISSEDERLVLDSDIRWYDRHLILDNKQNYNFYITTDFATSEKQRADYSAISVWAYNANGDWFWVDGVLKRQTMDKNVEDLFRLNQMYQPQSIGVEITGQQGGFIPWLRNEQHRRNSWFNFASSQKTNQGKNNEPGIRPQTDKLSRFHMMVPLFKAGKMYFPKEMRNEEIMQLGIGQLRLATSSGLKGKDDFIDTISMLTHMNPFLPMESTPTNQQDYDIWTGGIEAQVPSNLSSYIV